MDLLVDASHAYANLLRTIQPYIASLLRYLAPSMPYVTYTIGVLFEVLTPLFHTLRLASLTLSSFAIRGLTHALLALPPALHPVLILATLLVGLYVALLAVALLRRATAYLFRLLFNFALLSLAVGFAAYLYQRGLTQTTQDARIALDTLSRWWVEGERRGTARRYDWQAEGYRREKEWVDAAGRARRGGGGWW